jgi:hypothetical protein
MPLMDSIYVSTSVIDLPVPETWVQPLEFLFYHVYKLRFEYFRFGSRHVFLDFRLPVTRYAIDTSAIYLPVP